MILMPPEFRFSDRTFPSVFLAGSIEMGKATDWQTPTSESFSRLGWTVFNPRRKDWDSSWEQKIENPQFRGQVEWELAGLERSNYVFFYFEPNTLAPITLLEFGLFAEKKAIFCGQEESALAVICPEGFWRKGNVDIVCKRYNIPQFPDRSAAFYHLDSARKKW
jgi:hypothetical protein